MLSRRCFIGCRLKGKDKGSFSLGHVSDVTLTFKKRFTIAAWQAVLVVKNPPANAGNAGDAGLIPGWGRPPGGGHGNSL